MKTAAMGRGKAKDAYDIYFIIKHYIGGVKELAKEFGPVRGKNLVTEAKEKLAGKFASENHASPKDVVDFLDLEDEESIEMTKRDAYEQVQALLSLIIVFLYARSMNYVISVGRFAKLECDFIFRSTEGDYSYMQVAYTIMLSKETEDREYKSLEQIKDNYPKYVATTDYAQQKRNGILHINIINHMMASKLF